MTAIGGINEIVEKQSTKWVCFCNNTYQTVMAEYLYTYEKGGNPLIVYKKDGCDGTEPQSVFLCVLDGLVFKNIDVYWKDITYGIGDDETKENKTIVLFTSFVV